MLKNSTPRRIAILVSAYTAAATLLVLLAFFFLLSPGLDLHWLLLCLPVLVFVISYYFSLYYLQRYIYRKIKLIYKTIHRHKVSSDVKTAALDMDANIIEDVEMEVADWADEQQAEINRYKNWAEYRRRYVGDISHELKTPIFNIQGYLDTLIEGGLEDERVARPFLEKAARNVHRLHTIVEDLSAISRLESGELILDMEAFGIRRLTEEVIEELEYKANQNGIKLMVKEGAGQNFQVVADRESIRQVLTNLINNSLKYGNAAGRTRIGCYDMGDYILVEVADDGIGIPEKHLPHVFDRFYRVDKSRSRSQGGSGLGLSIVKHIMEAHQQTINVRSTPDLGSTFGFTLQKA